MLSSRNVVTGSLVAFCGIQLLWLARYDSPWCARWAEIFRQPLRQPAGPPGTTPRFHALLIILGISLVFILGAISDHPGAGPVKLDGTSF